MDPGTAAHKLRMDLLFQFAILAGHVCYQCGKELTRGTFSMEHKEPWLDSSDPKAKFFDLSNIGFSHNSCNAGAARKTNKVCYSLDERRKRNTQIQKEQWRKLPKEAQQERRRQKYLRWGK